MDVNTIPGIYCRVTWFFHSHAKTLLVQVCSVAAQLDTCQPTQSPHSELPAAIQALLSEFQAVFAPVDGLPPQRFCDHSIPLVLGAKPIFIRPYRYPPALKDEIEKQI